MATDKEIREAVELIKKALPNKNRYEQPLWQGVVDLIEKSKLGTENAEVEVVSPLPSGRNPIDEMLDGSFDGVQMQMLQINNAILGGHGEVGMEPYSSGLTTRSMKLSFKVKK